MHMRKLFHPTSILFRRGRLVTASTDVSVLSAVTNAPFSATCQTILRSVAKQKRYTKRYWVTLPQARRSCNAVVLPGESPTIIHLNVERVIPFSKLSNKVQKRIMDEHPPFFGSGVGILSSRMKWKAVTAERLLRLLNSSDEDRALYVDANIAPDLGIKVNLKDTVDIRSESSITVYNVEQLDDPYKGEPQKGVALNAVTGKRVGQPAHDVLLAVGIMRGYISPMWVGEKQLKYLNLEIKKGCEHEGVLAANMTGMIVSISWLPKVIQRELLKELKESHPDSFGLDLYFLYNVSGWEVMRSRILVKHMAALEDPEYPYHFVNIRDLGLQKPKHAAYARRLQGLCSPIGEKSFQILVKPKPTGKEDKVKKRKKESKREEDAEEEELEEEEEAKGEGQDNHGNGPKEGSVGLRPGLVIQQFKKSRRFFFAEDATLRRYYNAQSLTKPHLAIPAVRPVAILNGKLIGRRDEEKLRKFALKHKLSSPIWVTPAGARRMGVAIDKKNQSKYVSIGAGAVEDFGDEAVDEFYNLDDFDDREEILSVFPKESKSVHFLLDSKWRPVLGTQRQSFLSSLKRSTPLWVSVNECLMSGFQPKSGSQPVSFPSRIKTGVTDGGHRLYNSQFTTDPVRVIGVATVYTRPQGTTL